MPAAELVQQAQHMRSAHLCRRRCRLGSEAMRGTLSPLTSEPSATTEDVEPEGAGEAAPLGPAAAAAAAAVGRVITGAAGMCAAAGGRAGGGAMLQSG